IAVAVQQDWKVSGRVNIVEWDSDSLRSAAVHVPVEVRRLSCALCISPKLVQVAGHIREVTCPIAVGDFVHAETRNHACWWRSRSSLDPKLLSPIHDVRLWRRY